MDVFQEAEQLRKVPMLSKLDASKLKLLAFTSEAVTYHDGEILVYKDDPSDSAYVILAGVVQVMAKTDTGDLVPVVELGQYTLIGEMAVLSNRPRSATLRAKGGVKTLRISNDMFLKLLSENADVALDVMRQLSEKLANSHKQVEDLQNRLRRYEDGSGPC